MYNLFVHPAAFLWSAAGVAISKVCVYFFDRQALRETPDLTEWETHVIALALAIVTAPWTFFIPVWGKMNSTRNQTAAFFVSRDKGGGGCAVRGGPVRRPRGETGRIWRRRFLE